ncbi:MAG: ATP-dependent zinc metalloprotease FtsH [Kiritimatiellae bacterium]|nr:ATP-dependent zinc metalloprotease FtsH [Kiritimatiellia bacterium]MDD5519272.1 ATP-dependent zinc metalloprotease FtsH [Kiritimatiellia bacterium]
MEENKEQPKTPGRRADTSGQQSPIKGILSWALILSLMLFMMLIFMKKRDVYTEIGFNPEFVDYVKSGKIEKCEIVKEISGVDYVKGQFRHEKTDPASAVKKFKVYVQAGDALEKLLNENKVTFAYVPQSIYLSQIILNILPVLLIFGILYFLFMRQVRSAGTGALSFGKSRARLLSRDKHKVTFENVAGIDEAKEEVQEIIEFLKDPKRFQKLGGRIPKGVLLMGQPGTGKTLLAKAIAGEANVPFFSISGSDFVEMFVGVGASRVRDMFEQGKKNAPCLMFIDEIDAVGRSRFSGIGGGHDEREQTLNALLVEMDGFETQQGVIIIAATNRPDVLDPALLRPGRFDRQIVIDLPTIDGREAILKMHAKGIKLSNNAELRRIARGTPGFSGADLENLLNEAALLAARENKEGVDMKDLEEARDKVRWGRERRSRVLDEKEKKITAYHEAGHALVMQIVEDSEPLHKITIIPRGVAYLGATMQLPEKDKHMEGKQKLQGILSGMMGGRVAEETFFGDITSGASADLREATRIARLMVCDWGMSMEMGPQTYGKNEDLTFLGREITRTQDYSEETAKRIDDEINVLLRQSHDKAKKIVEDNRDKLEMIANLLLERETLDGRDVEEIVKHGRILSEQEREEIDKAKEKEEALKKNNGKAMVADTDKNPPPLP